MVINGYNIRNPFQNEGSMAKFLVWSKEGGAYEDPVIIDAKNIESVKAVYAEQIGIKDWFLFDSLASEFWFQFHAPTKEEQRYYEEHQGEYLHFPDIDEVRKRVLAYCDNNEKWCDLLMKQYTLDSDMPKEDYEDSCRNLDADLLVFLWNKEIGDELWNANNDYMGIKPISELEFYSE
jgi:hypothetical protein